MSEYEDELTWDQADTLRDRRALIFGGVQVAAVREIIRLHKEGYPVLDWKDGKVVDVTEEKGLQITGRFYFLIGLAMLGAIPVLGVIFYFAAKTIFSFFVPFMTLALSLMGLATFGLGAWYGDKPTRRNCLILIAAVLPTLVYLTYWWLNGGFRFGF